MRDNPPVCPSCGAKVGEAPECPSCRTDLRYVGKLPLRSDWELDQRIAVLPQPPPSRPREPMTCPKCYGSGRNRRGGPCGYCQATGEVRGLMAFGATVSALGGAITSLFWSLVALAIIVVLIVAAIQS